MPYIICIDRSGGEGGGGGEAGGAASGRGLAQRAYHIDEVRAPGAQLEVDAAYYLSQQARACASAPETTLPSDCAHGPTETRRAIRRRAQQGCPAQQPRACS